MQRITECEYDPTKLVGLPIGMFHCPLCGEMIVAGFPHPNYSLLEDLDNAEI